MISSMLQLKGTQVGARNRLLLIEEEEAQNVLSRKKEGEAHLISCVYDHI